MGNTRRKRHSQQRLRVASIIGISALVVVTGSLTAFALLRAADPPSTASNDPGFSVSAQPTPAPIAMHQGSRVLVFGDSYTAGYGADPQTEGYAYKLGALTGWDVTIDGVGSTGYLNAGQEDQGTFKQRLDRSNYGDDFDLVILQGGSNDQKVTDGDLPGAISDVVTTVQARFPSAGLVVVGPVSVSSKANDDKRRVNGALRAYTYQHNLAFISPVSEIWFRTADQSTLINASVGHPNAAGYTVMAQKLVEGLQRFIAAEPAATASTG